MSKKNVILSSTIFIQTLSSQIFFRFVRWHPFSITGYPLSLIFRQRGVSLRVVVVVDIYPRRWQKVSRNAHFLRVFRSAKSLFGESTGVQVWETVKDRSPLKRVVVGKEGRSEKKGEHFDGGSSGFSCSRMRTCSFLL